VKEIKGRGGGKIGQKGFGDNQLDRSSLLKIKRASGSRMIFRA